jgi:peptide/nickel transport system ATP-binding protein
MSDAAVVLDARELEIEYATAAGAVRSLDSASLAVRAGEITAVVGESGSGKSTLGMATGRLLAGNARHAGGELLVGGTPVFDCDEATLRRLRRDFVGYVFQNPVAALDPTMRVQRQMELVGGAQGATEALEEVGLRDVPRVLRSYPHELSGGMAQRVGIAMALRRQPRLLIADEPTAAVDATLRNQILDLLVSRCRAQDCALLLLTHDLHAVAEHCSHVAVMYGGRVVEDGTTSRILDEPLHPYTRALVGALPGEEAPGERLEAIPGVPPVLRGASPGCAFTPRCPLALEHCGRVRPVHARVGDRALCCHVTGVDTLEIRSDGGERAPTSAR